MQLDVAVRSLPPAGNTKMNEHITLLLVSVYFILYNNLYLNIVTNTAFRTGTTATNGKELPMHFIIID